MTLASWEEIIGDWNNLKGTAYHLVYAIWLLLRDGASEVAFYGGNDLTARYAPTAPPGVDSTRNEQSISMRSDTVDGDIWIQLKSTEEDWTPSKLLDEELMANYICNAISSESQGRNWKVRLTTQARVRKVDIEEFLADPTNHNNLNNKLNTCVSTALARIQASGMGSAPTAADLHDLALQILTQLSFTQPVRMETLRAEIELELAYGYPDRVTVGQIANTLLGALLKDAAAGPPASKPYNTEWIRTVTGISINSRTLLRDDPLAACREEITKALPRNWATSKCLPRPSLDAILNQFLQSPQTVFVLIGASGAGKSWAITRWAFDELTDRPRLLIPATDLRHNHTLHSLIGPWMDLFAPPEWNDSQRLLHLQAVAKRTKELVVVLDDIYAPSTPEAAQDLRQELAHIAAECHELNVKLVLTCQQQIWELNALADDLPPDSIFNQGVLSKPEDTTRSFILGDLTLDEQSAIVRQRLDASFSKLVIPHLRDAAFIDLRNPYLLERYLEDLSRAGPSAPISNTPSDVGKLLDGRIRESLIEAADTIGVGIDDLIPLVDKLTNSLWLRRPEGISYVEAVECLAPLGKEAVAALRRVGLIAYEGTVRLAEPRISEHIFAERLRTRVSDIASTLKTLRPEVDGAVASTLLRITSDPVPIAEQLLAQDQQWEQAIADGLAMCDPDDYRILALVTCLTRPRADNLMGFAAACDALGRLAARSPRAARWVACMYLDSDWVERVRGGRALANMMKYSPKKTVAIARLRLARASYIDDKSLLAAWLDDALTPFLEIDPTSVHSGYHALSSYGKLLKLVSNDQQGRLLREYDEVHGMIAVVDPDKTQLNQLIEDLASSDLATRRHAAQALRSISINYPDAIHQPLLQAIKVETDPSVLSDLLQATSQLIKLEPKALLAVIKSCPLFNWNNLSNATGPMLSVMWLLSDSMSNDIYPQLPTRLSADGPDAKALLSEGLVCAYWGCAQHLPQVHQRITELSEPDLTNVSNEYRLFAFRGAAMAQLASIMLDIGIMDEPSGPLFYYHFQSSRVPWMKTDGFIHRYTKQILSHPDYVKLESLLLNCVKEGHRYEASLLDRSLQQGQYWCMRLCAEMLVILASKMSDPLTVLSQFPRDWEALYAARRLLEEGRTETSITDFAQRACDEHTNGGTTQSSSERVACIATLARLSLDPDKALKEAHRQLGSPHTSFNFILGGREGRLQSLTQLSEEHSARVLTLLEESIDSESNLPILYDWPRETHSWISLLLARVYARMFDLTPISAREACELCTQVIIALHGLPADSLTAEYRLVYEAIKNCLVADGSPVPTLSAHAGDSESIIWRSHEYTLKLLTDFQNMAPSVHSSSLSDVLLDRHGWWETEDIELKAGQFSTGNNLYLIYVLPAVRLALVAIGQQYNALDPAAQFMQERIEGRKIIQKHSLRFLLYNENAPKDLLNDALIDLEKQIMETPNDERVMYGMGNVLLRLGRYADAVARLQECLAMSWCTMEMRASALYDLGCAYARMGCTEECQKALTESRQLRASNLDWWSKDLDLASVQDLDWFQHLVTEGD